MSYRSQRANPIVTLVIGIVFLVGSFFAMKYGKKSMQEAEASLEWPTVQGIVVHSDVNRSRDSDGDTTYKADIVYEYVVNNVSLESNQRRIGAKTSSSNSKGAYKVTKQYPKGKDVTVYYDPESPENAVLEPGVFMESKIMYYVGIGLLVIGLLMVGSMLLKVLMVGGFIMAKR